MIELFWVLHNRGHGSTLREDRWHGVQNPRFLTMSGRWVTHAKPSDPLLIWRDEPSAQEAAATASFARKADIVVTNIGGSDLRAGKQLIYFEDCHQSALQGFLPYTGVKAKKLEIERLKVVGYARAVWLVHQSPSEETRKQIIRKVNQELLTLFGGGSWQAAANYLAGNKGQGMIERVLSGELPLGDGLTREEFVGAVSIARDIAAATS